MNEASAIDVRQRMADVAEGQRVVAGHDRYLAGSGRPRVRICRPAARQEADDVVVPVVRQRVLQHAQRDPEQRQNQERLEERAIRLRRSMCLGFLGKLILGARSAPSGSAG